MKAAAARPRASGHAAQILAFFPLMSPATTIVASNKLYGGSITQMKTFPKFGWKTEVRRCRRPRERRARHRRRRPRPSSSRAWPIPAASSVDIEPLAEIAHAAGVPLMVDNTLATPYPLPADRAGRRLVIHSTTKFLSGNGTSMGGASSMRQIRLGQNGKFPQPDRARARPITACASTRPSATWPIPCTAMPVGLRDLGPPIAVQRLPDPARHRDTAAAHGAPCRERAGGGAEFWRSIPP